MPIELPGTIVLALSLGTLALIYGQLTLGLNVHFGYTGLINFGHVAFFAAGAYVAALLSISPESQIGDLIVGFNLPHPLTLPITLGAAAIAGAVLAFLIGTTCVRLGSHYLALATFALAEVFHTILLNEEWLTGGVFGLTGVPQSGKSLFGAGDGWILAYFIFTALVTLGILFVVNRLVESPFGRLLKGIREDEVGAEMLGKNTIRNKLQSFMLGGGIAGLAGGLFAHYLGTVVPAQFIANITFFAWIGLLIGGAGSNLGAIVGGIIFIGLRSTTRFLPTFGYAFEIAQLRFVVIGLVLVLIIRYYPQGLLGTAGEIVEKEK